MNKSLLLFFLFCFGINICFGEENDFLGDLIINSHKPDINVNYDYTNTKIIPIKLTSKQIISTKDNSLYEGKKLEFRAIETSFFEDKPIVKEGQIVTGEISLIISSGMNGIPYSIVLDNFEINGIDKRKLKSTYQKNGFNRTGFVLPLKWALTPLWPMGSFTNFIKGGHSKITPKDIITIYYYPQVI